MSEQVITRVAPSPTGLLHIGLARTALFNYLYAKKHGGQFILRIEDTDKKRSRAVYEKDILDELRWLGITHDKLYRQSERTPIYQTAIEKLVEGGKAYTSKEPEKNDPSKSIEVVRLKNSGGEVTFTDLIRGKITTGVTNLGDLVIARGLDDPLYHLAVVVDDESMGVTHVIRGEDHIPNTARQILIQRALGYKEPNYAHIPLILTQDRSKMSKREGNTALKEYRERGYLPSAIINHLALLGWNPGTNQEMHTLETLVAAFDFDGVQAGGAIFNEEKLDWFNRAYIKELPPEDLMANVETYLPERIKKLPQFSKARLEFVLPTLIEHIAVFEDVAHLAKAGDLNYYFIEPRYKPESLLWKDEKDLKKTGEHIMHIIKSVKDLPENKFDEANIKKVLWDYATKEGRGEVLWPMRFALSGKEKSPDPFTLAFILGKEETIKRLEQAVTLINGT